MKDLNLYIGLATIVFLASVAAFVLSKAGAMFVLLEAVYFMLLAVVHELQKIREEIE